MLTRQTIQRACKQAAEYFRADASRWLQCALARDSRDSSRDVTPLDKHADQFCAVGAIEHFLAEWSPAAYSLTTELAREVRRNRSFHIESYNDPNNRRVEEVIDLLEQMAAYGVVATEAVVADAPIEVVIDTDVSVTHDSVEHEYTHELVDA